MVAIGAGLMWIFSDKPDTSTDDAYVRADETIVSPKARGAILQVMARENQPVKVGDPLVRLDPEEYDLALRAAEGDLMAANASGEGGPRRPRPARRPGSCGRARSRPPRPSPGPRAPADPALRQAFETARGQALIEVHSRGELERRARLRPPSTAPTPSLTRPSCRRPTPW